MTLCNFSKTCHIWSFGLVFPGRQDPELSWHPTCSRGVAQSCTLCPFYGRCGMDFSWWPNLYQLMSWIFCSSRTIAHKFVWSCLAKPWPCLFADDSKIWNFCKRRLPCWKHWLHTITDLIICHPLYTSTDP